MWPTWPGCGPPWRNASRADERIHAHPAAGDAFGTNTLRGASTSGSSLLRYVSTARSDPSPSTFVALTRQFAGRLWKGARALRAIHFRGSCVYVQVQQDAPVEPYETSSVGETSDSIRTRECTPVAESVDGYPESDLSIFSDLSVINRDYGTRSACRPGS